eukprot:scaffold4163_cov153-Skeletonema_dohrnii-CCMP3373.AAC.1
MEITQHHYLIPWFRLCKVFLGGSPAIIHMMVVFVAYYHIDVIPPPVATARCYAATASNPAHQSTPFH